MVPCRGPGRYARRVNERFGVMERVAVAYRALADLAESVEDEWQYVTDLTDAYLPAIRALADADSGRALDTGQVVALDEAMAEIALIEDPHKAIDWLSTFPHIVALAVGGSVDEGSSQSEPGPDLGTDAPDDDSPFRILLGGGR